MDTEQIPLLKVITVGNGRVGKTSLIRRFCKGDFEGGYKQTLGVDFLQRTEYVKSLRTDVIYQLWDTSGQEEYRSLTRRYFRRSHAALLVFSLTDRQSFDDLHTWRAVVLEECGHIPMFVVQNKSDLEAERAITGEEVKAQCLHWELPLHCLSVKENIGLSRLFEVLALQSLTQSLPSTSQPSLPAVTLTSPPPTSQQRRSRLLSYCLLL